MGDDLWRLNAGQVAQAIASRDLSCVEVMRAALARIDAVNGAVNAIVSLRDREALMGEARLADAMGSRGPLHGIPVAVKDLAETKGLRTTFGSPIFADYVPDRDDVAVARMKAAGAIVIGKTNVPEYGLGSHSTNPLFGPTGNPFDLSRTAGGSSGGAAAALATGMVSIADGSDMMGSLRNPAAWCDVWGMRPSVGRVPGEPRDHALLHRLSTSGPMARSVADLRLLLEVLAGDSFAKVALRKPPRIAWMGDWGGAFPMEEGVLDAAEVAVARAGRDLGWQIEAVPPPMAAQDLWHSWTTLRSFVVAQDLARHWRDPVRRTLLNPQAIWEVERGLALSGDAVEQAAAIRRDWLAALKDLFSRFDALMLPAAQVWPFPVDWDWPREIGGEPTDTYHRWMEVVVPASLAGIPALSLPAGYSATGLPHGVQCLGAPGADAAMLTLAEDWEQMMGPRQPRDPA